MCSIDCRKRFVQRLREHAPYCKLVVDARKFLNDVRKYKKLTADDKKSAQSRCDQLLAVNNALLQHMLLLRLCSIDLCVTLKLGNELLAVSMAEAADPLLELSLVIFALHF